jgi:hypothetical protein
VFRRLSQLDDIRGSLPRNGSYGQRNWSQINGIARHHSATTSGDAFTFADWHVTNPSGNRWPGVGYHFVITRDGTIQWSNSVNRISYHVGNNNSRIIGICLVGNGSFTDAQEQSWIELVRALRNSDGLNISIENIKGHNEYPGHAWNQCPGINMDTVRSRIRNSPEIKSSKEGPRMWEPTSRSIKDGAVKAMEEMTDKDKYGNAAIGQDWVDKAKDGELTLDDAAALGMYIARHSR